MNLLFFISLLRKDNGIADIGYGIAFIVLSFSVYVVSPPAGTLTLALLALVLVWGVRLAVRIFSKNAGKPEDFRYKAWRDAWGVWFIPRSYLQVYMLQGLVVFLVCLPITLSFAYPALVPSMGLFSAGLLLWVFGFFFEVVGDYQLDRFITAPENKGKIMTQGLWKYSRHPNYFGESLMWWGMAVMAASLSAYPFIGFVSPVLITFLLLKVSGVPMLEKRWEGNPAWEAYKKRTSVYLPLPPKQDAS
jgi:steroid 5-alpha reductase family enzyme